MIDDRARCRNLNFINVIIHVDVGRRQPAIGNQLFQLQGTVQGLELAHRQRNHARWRERPLALGANSGFPHVAPWQKWAFGMARVLRHLWGHENIPSDGHKTDTIQNKTRNGKKTEKKKQDEAGHTPDKCKETKRESWPLTVVRPLPSDQNVREKRAQITH